MFKRVRVTYWLLRGFLKRHTGLLILGVILGIVSAIVLPRLLPVLPKPKPQERIAVIGRPTLTELPTFIQQEVSLGLTAMTPSGEAASSLAKSMRIEADGRRYRFILQDGIRWHDGKPLTAKDINYQFTDVSVSTPTDVEIIFELKEPFAPFPTLVSQPIFRSSKSRFFPQSRTLLGLGKMRVRKLTRNGQYVVDLLLESDEVFRRYRFYGTQEAAILAFKLGEVDTILELSSPGVLAGWPNTTIEEVIHPDRYVALFFNTEDPLLSEKSIRQALTYAIPEKAAKSIRAISPIHPQSWAYNPQVKPYDYNLESAKRLLSAEGDGALRAPQHLELTTTLPYLEIAEAIKGEWSKLGITTTIKVVTFLPESFQTLLIAQEIPSDPDQYILWHSIQPSNLTRYNSPKVDKLLEDGRRTVNQQERIQIYQDFQRFLVEDSPAAFLFHHRTYTVHRS